MNMIMHGDGHGGIHHHDGLVDINGIFPMRFDAVITNPPFGSKVGADQKVDGGDETRVHRGDAYRAACRERYGDGWEQSYRRLLDAAGTNILELFEIGKGKVNRATEIVFVERCLSLLKPGGRMGIVLPDGNLNNPSLSWLRRWCEGKARILAVISLPEETFRSADATVKASLVFFRRFTATDEEKWEAAWAEAHNRHDHLFNTKRDALCAEFGRRIVTGESATVGKILDELTALGVERTEPAWSAGVPPDYPRGIGPTKLSSSRRNGAASDRKRVAQHKRDYAAAFDGGGSTRTQADTLLRELRAGLRALDEVHNSALWGTVRESFDYPVFLGVPKTAGITSTGETGGSVSNNLPQLLDAYRAFFVPNSGCLHGEFVKLVLRTGGFLSALRAKASGTSGRKRIASEAFLDLRIPLPPLNQQRAIVAAHRVGRDRADELESEANEVEAQVMASFESALGFTPPPPVPDRPVFVAAFKDLDRWSHEGVLRTMTHSESVNPRFPVVESEACIAPSAMGGRKRRTEHGAGVKRRLGSGANAAAQPSFSPVVAARTGLASGLRDTGLHEFVQQRAGHRRRRADQGGGLGC